MTDTGALAAASVDAPAPEWTRRVPRRRVRVPTVLQLEATECGAASLGMVLAYFGRWVPLEHLRDACGVSRDGVNARSIAVAARAEGLDVTGRRRTLPELADVALPVIAYWGFNHFVVIEGVGPSGLRLNDPATGRRDVSWEEADRDFTGLVLEFARAPGFRRQGRPPSPWRGIAARWAGNGPALAYLVVAGLALAVPVTLAPMALQGYVDRVVIDGLSEWVPVTIATLAVATGLTLWLSWLQGTVARRLGAKMTAQQATAFMEHALRLPVSFYTQRYAGDVATRVELVDIVSRVASAQVIPALLGLVTAAAVGGLLFLYSWQLALVAVAAAVLVVIAVRTSGRWRFEASGRLAREQGVYSGALTYGLRGMETIKASGTTDEFFATATGHHARLTNARTALQVPATLLSALPSLVAGLVGAAIVAGGGLLVANDDLSAGGYVAMFTLLPLFLGPLAAWTAVGSTTQQVRAALDRLDDLLAQPIDPSCADWTAEPDLATTRTGILALRDITFGYRRTAPPLITGFTLDIAPGRRVALVGASGSGKSTLGRLAVGLLDPWSGSVTLDGVPLPQARALRVAELAYVDQEIVLFEGTVRDNITLFDADVADDAVIAAARAAGIHEEIVERPAGYEAIVADDGSNFSGGQCQRIEIARAMARRPRLIVLDEATSALDPIVEQAVMSSLAATGAGLLIIAHRLSTVRDCDEIIVIENGAVLERGTHDALMAADGGYARLARA